MDMVPLASFVAISLAGGVWAEPSKESCGNVLLQASQAVHKQEEVMTALDAPHAAGWLGWGRWVAKQDLWHMAALSGESLFASDMPGSCFKEASCRHTHTFTSQSFNSVESWSDYFSSSFGMGVGGSYSGFSASVDASLGSTTSSSGSVSKRLSYAVQASQRRCYRLVRDESCAYNRSHLQPALLSRLAALPTGSPYDTGKMEAWKVSFVQRFGTHVAMASSHGARVHSLASVDSRSEVSSDCMTSGLCGSFGYVAAGSAKLCSNTSSCDKGDKGSTSQKSTCVAVGGDPVLQRQVCQQDVSQETLDAWIQGGDTEAGSSAYKFSFMPISDFLTNVDFDLFYDAAATLTKAVEYSNCRIGLTPPMEAWQESRCQCVRRCENGGTLDAGTCTCRCPGNAKQGWTGPTCATPYGSCQPGPGTGNPGAARRCPRDGKCASWFESKTCSATQVCCTTNFGTTCCPFGSSCQCTSDKCKCTGR